METQHCCPASSVLGIELALADLWAGAQLWPNAFAQLPRRWPSAVLFGLPLILWLVAAWLSRPVPVLGPFSLLMMVIVIGQISSLFLVAVAHGGYQVRYHLNGLTCFLQTWYSRMRYLFLARYRIYLDHADHQLPRPFAGPGYRVLHPGGCPEDYEFARRPGARTAHLRTAVQSERRYADA